MILIRPNSLLDVEPEVDVAVRRQKRGLAKHFLIGLNVLGLRQQMNTLTRVHVPVNKLAGLNGGGGSTADGGSIGPVQLPIGPDGDTVAFAGPV